MHFSDLSPTLQPANRRFVHGQSKKGTKAPQAAGKIHSDFERGFIRAEVIAYDDLIACGSMTAAKEKKVLSAVKARTML